MDRLAHLTRALPAADALGAAARLLVEAEAAHLPDLSRLVVLLPNVHAAAPFARALGAAAACPALLLPQLTTLPQWARGATGAGATLPDSVRQSLIYDALRSRRWLDEGSLWTLAGELAALFDEMTLHHLPLPECPGDFAAQLARAYGARAGESLQFEARLVHELWHAMHETHGGQLDGARAYQARLAVLADAAPAPLYAVGLAELAPCEVEFFLRYAERQPVTLLRSRPLATAAGALAQLLAASWTESTQSLAERAATLAASHPVSPLAGRLCFTRAHSLEQQAQAAALQVRRWLTEDKRDIAIVAQDRLAARRVRALLERDGVLVEDETGWTLSTTAASTVVMRWLDLLGSDFFHQDLLDFLKLPAVFADSPAAERRNAVYELEQMIRKEGLVSHLRRYLIHAQRHAPACVGLLKRLEDAKQPWRERTRTLAGWLDTLRETLDRLGVTGALAADLAGTQLLATLTALAAELRDDTSLFSLSEWRRWLEWQLETFTFRDASITSPVVFTHLAATRLRRFDGAILLGCDADHLPSRDASGAFFNQAVRARLGLPTQAARMRLELEDLAALLSNAASVLVTWQCIADGEERLMSPWFDLLQTVHHLAWHDDLVGASLMDMDAPSEAAGGTVVAAPRLPAGCVPDTISASAYASLVACPYQYFARHVLKLNELDEVAVEMEKRDFGEVVHGLLLTFHQTHPRLRDADPKVLEQDLRALSERAFAPLLRLNYLSHAWRLQWEALIPQYINWQIERERAGWCWEAGEAARSRSLPLPDGTVLTLKGTLDRLDRAGDAVAVLDYKARDAGDLRKQLKAPGEDVQLPVYALLAGATVAEAAYVSLEKGAVKTVPLEGDIKALSGAVAERLTDIFAALRAGAPLPAHGDTDACGRCEMEGLCRRAYLIRRRAIG